MGWQELLAQEHMITVPWVGGREIRHEGRTFYVKGRLPREHGWHEFMVAGGRDARHRGPGQPRDLFGKPAVLGYLVGNRLLRDGRAYDTDPARIAEESDEVLFPDEGLEMFSRISAVPFEDGKLLFRVVEFPLGPEADVLTAFEDDKDNVLDVPEVTPALVFAYRFERWKKAERERRRREAEEQRRREEAERQRQERIAAIRETMGDGELRRELAKTDFEAAARACLQLSGAEYLGHRRIGNGETAVKYRFLGRRLECVVNDNLAIIDAGVCLDNHRGTKYDTHFTLESLPTVIDEAIRRGRLVVWRHG